METLSDRDILSTVLAVHALVWPSVFVVTDMWKQSN